MRTEMAYHGLSQHVELDRAAEPRDRFTLQELIGEGTYGEVYCARDKKTGKRVAVKVPNITNSTLNTNESIAGFPGKLVINSDQIVLKHSIVETCTLVLEVLAVHLPR